MVLASLSTLLIYILYIYIHFLLLVLQYHLSHFPSYLSSPHLPPTFSSFLPPLPHQTDLCDLFHASIFLSIFLPTSFSSLHHFIHVAFHLYNNWLCIPPRLNPSNAFLQTTSRNEAMLKEGVSWLQVGGISSLHARILWRYRRPLTSIHTQSS